MSAHPISRFVAPSSIQTGSSLADLLGPLTIRLIAESFGSDFDQEGFLKAAIEAAIKQVTDAAQELGKAVYEAASTEATAGGGDDAECCGEGDCSADDVIDAEYEVKDDEA